MKTYIYTLYCPITNQPRYIYKALPFLRDKIKNIGIVSTADDKQNWIKLLLRQNLKPIIEVLDKVNKNEWQFWEQYYIELYKSWNFNLTNTTIGGMGGSIKGIKRTEQTKKLLSEKLKGNKNDKYSKGIKRNTCWNKGLKLVNRKRP
jgi:hypothetical protein